MNRYKIKITAPTQYILNMFRQYGVVAKNVVCGSRSVQCVICKNDYDKLKLNLNKCGISCEIISIYGIRNTMKQVVNMYGSIVGVLAIMVGMIVYNSGLFSLNIYGNSAVSDDLIKQEIIEKCGNIFGAFSSVNVDTVQQAVLDINGISYVSVERVGTELCINIVEESTKVDINDTQTYNNIVSKYDGIITSISVVSGTALVGVGSVVCAGDVLIGAYKLDAEGEKQPIHAEGTATGRVALSKHITYADKSMVEVRTGKQTSYTTINILGMQNIPQSPYEIYDMEQEKRLCTSLLSYEIITTTYYEKTAVLAENNFEQNKDKIIKAEQEKFFSTISKEFVYLKNWYLVKRLDKMTILSIYYEIETTMA